MGVLAAVLLVAQAWSVWQPASMELGHDEAEHLHVVFALERGERPYRDFIENHPVLPHLMLSALRRLCGVDDSMTLYTLGRSLALLHALGVLALMAGWLHRQRAELGLCLHPAVTLPLALVLPGIWNVATEVPGRFDFVWQMRADWPCHFWTLAAVLCAMRGLRKLGQPAAWWLAVGGGLCAGFASALLTKSVMFLVPAALALLLTLRRRHAVQPPDAATLRLVARLALTFAVVAALAFSACVAFELWASGVTLRDYLGANLSLNSSKHLVSSAADRSSINMLRELSGLGLGGAAVLTVASFALAARAAREGRWWRYGLICFIAMVFVLTAVLPAYSNGLAWPQYMIPAYVALALLAILVIDAGVEAAGNVRLPARWGLSAPAARAMRCAPAVLLAVLLLGGLLVRVGDFQLRLGEIRSHALLSEQMVGDATVRSLPDRLLPDDLSYLAAHPHDKPVKARAWSYFFMLWGDKGIWADNHRAGLGPDPTTYWLALYRQAPPDVIAVASRSELRSHLRAVKTAQQVDLTWLDQALADDYVCVSKVGAAVHVRHALQPRFEQAGFRPCKFVPTSADWM